MVLTEGITALRPMATGGPNAIPLFVGREHAADIARSMGLSDFALFRITKKAIPKCLLKWDNSARAHAMVSFISRATRYPLRRSPATRGQAYGFAWVNAVAHGSRGDSATPPAFSGRNWDQANLYPSLGEGHTTPLFSIAERVRAAIQGHFA